jgi:hypothetical protein
LKALASFNLEFQTGPSSDPEPSSLVLGVIAMVLPPLVLRRVF